MRADIQKGWEVSGRSIWILEDHSSCKYMYELLFAEKNELFFATSIKELLDAMQVADGFPDLLILDIKLPDGLLTDYLHLGYVQGFISRVPTLVVSMLGDLSTMRQWYEQGIFEYLVKPFNGNELTVRLERLLRFNLMNMILRAKLGLTATEEQIIEMFFKKASLNLNKEELRVQIWPHVQVVSKTVDVHLSNLRKKLLPLGFTITYIKNQQWRLDDQRA